MTRLSLQRRTRPFAMLRPDPVVQRKCAACGSGQAGAMCAACNDETRPIQRQASPPVAEWASEAPPIVHEVLNSPGAPLPPSARAFFEPRFDHDFSGVRVHTDAKATASAQAVNAEAYTVGNDIVFAAGKWSGGANDGLLAHELAHAVQQGAGLVTTVSPLAISSPNDPAEREADSLSRDALAGRPVRPGAAPSGRLFRQEEEKPSQSLAPADATQVAPPAVGFGDVRIAEQLHGDRAAEEERRSKETGPVNLAGRPLIQVDIDNAVKAVKGAASPVRITPAIKGARFVLHDTAAEAAQAKIKGQMEGHAAKKRRSAGEGAAAWVTKEGTAYVSHDPLFGGRRPTASKWERGEDLTIDTIKITGDKTRSLLRTVWRATKAADRNAALEFVLTEQGLKADEQETKDERAKAKTQLDGSGDEVHSAAAWTVERICSQVTDDATAAALATKDGAPDLKSTCSTLNTLFTIRAGRIAQTVNVEMVKPKGPGKGYETDPKTGAKKFPPYYSEVYDSVRDLYVKAALQARLFPEIMSHRKVDMKISGGHGDPRCFNLNCLYEKIAAAFGHPAGTDYGTEAKPGIYGTSDDKDIWWHPWVCDAPIPTPGSCLGPLPPPPEKKTPAKKPAGKKPK